MVVHPVGEVSAFPRAAAVATRASSEVVEEELQQLNLDRQPSMATGGQNCSEC